MSNQYQEQDPPEAFEATAGWQPLEPDPNWDEAAAALELPEDIF